MTVQARHRKAGGGAFGAGTGDIIILGNGPGFARRGGNVARKARGMPYSPLVTSPKLVTGSKIIVSNLQYHVTEADLKELFATHIGQLRRVALSFDASGRSRGVAEVVFRADGDAAIACQRFNNALLDGRPMKVEVVLQAHQLRRKIIVGRPNDVNGGKNASPAGGISQGKRGPNRSRRGQARWEPKNRPRKTVDELDAEMAAYMSAATLE